MTTSTQQTVDPMFHKLMADACARAQTLSDHYAAMEAEAMNRMKSAIALWAQLATDALAYTAQLSAEARKLTMDAARRVAQ